MFQSQGQVAEPQQKVSAPVISYEGQTVSSIALAGQPDLSAKPSLPIAQPVAGISQLQIDPSLGSTNGQSPGARIAIQQRVTSSLFVTVATDVISTQLQSVELEYQLNPRWSISAVRDQNGGVTGQVHYKRKF